jgi:uncharacterized membrane protein
MDLRAELRRSFVAGVLLVAPLAVTLFVAWLAVGYLSGVLDPVVDVTGLARFVAESVLAQALAAVLFAVALVALGFLAQRGPGERLFGGFDRLVGIVPVASVVYSSVRQVGTALSDRSSRYDRVVIVEYPRLGVYSLGFLTGDAPTEVSDVAGEPTHNVFVPNSPNPTGGRLVLVPDSRVHETEIPVRRGAAPRVDDRHHRDRGEPRGARDDRGTGGAGWGLTD